MNEMEQNVNEEISEGLIFIGIQLTRIYDTLLRLLPEEKQDELLSLHANGDTLSPTPFLQPGIFEENDLEILNEGKNG